MPDQAEAAEREGPACGPPALPHAAMDLLRSRRQTRYASRVSKLLTRAGRQALVTDRTGAVWLSFT